MKHLHVLLKKELVDIARNKSAMLPVALVTIISLALPFAIALIIPLVTGHHLGSDSDLVKISQMAGTPEFLTDDARVQLFLFEQFLTLFLITPITGAMALAAHAIVGEKTGRTLEPLLASPISTAELLVAKVLGALVPTLAFSAAGVLVYFAVIVLYAQPGVAASMLTLRTLLLTVAVGPLSALVALQLTVLVSSRVNDARTAQQFGVLIILPLTALVVAQFTGTFWLTASQMALVAVGLLAVWLLLMLVSIPLFDREAILTRWQ